MQNWPPTTKHGSYWCHMEVINNEDMRREGPVLTTCMTKREKCRNSSWNLVGRFTLWILICWSVVEIIHCHKNLHNESSYCGMTIRYSIQSMTSNCIIRGDIGRAAHLCLTWLNALTVNNTEKQVIPGQASTQRNTPIPVLCSHMTTSLWMAIKILLSRYTMLWV